MISPEHACRGKQRFPNKRVARAARRRTISDGHLNIYACPFCDAYHLGHLPKVIVAGELSRADWRQRGLDALGEEGTA